MLGRIINSLDKKYGLGLLTGLLFGLLGIYAEFIRTNNPSIEFNILTNTTVVDLKENVGKIDILYDSVRILKRKQTLAVITVKISNNGSGDILKNFYDKNFPLGIEIVNGLILEKPTLIESSNTYLNQSFKLSLTNQNTIFFNDFIFEKNEFIVLKILVLHNNGNVPKIIPVGKVAGVNKINVVNSYLKEPKGFWQNVSDGSVIVHITRFFLLPAFANINGCNHFNSFHITCRLPRILKFKSKTKKTI